MLRCSTTSKSRCSNARQCTLARAHCAPHCSYSSALSAESAARLTGERARDAGAHLAKMSMRLAMKASLESAAARREGQAEELRKAKKEAKRARKAELAAAAEAAAPAAAPAPAPAAPRARGRWRPRAAGRGAPGAATTGRAHGHVAAGAAGPAARAAPPPAPEPSARRSRRPAPRPSPEARPRRRRRPHPKHRQKRPPCAPASPRTSTPSSKEVDLDEMNMKSLRKKVASDLNIEIAGEDKDWFKEHVTKRVQARAEPDEEDEDPRHPLISEDMSAVVGVSRANHFRLVKLLWKYIKANNLQNPANRNEILCDEKLKKVFKRDKVTGFGMSKLLGQHIFKDGEATKPKAPKKKKKQREPSDDESE